MKILGFHYFFCSNDLYLLFKTRQSLATTSVFFSLVLQYFEASTHLTKQKNKQYVRLNVKSKAGVFYYLHVQRSTNFLPILYMFHINK